MLLLIVAVVADVAVVVLVVVVVVVVLSIIVVIKELIGELAVLFREPRAATVRARPAAVVGGSGS